MVAIIYFSLTILCCGYAAVRGGAPERWGVAILVSAIGASALATFIAPVHFRSFDVGVWIVDSCLFLALTMLAMRAQRYWPMWMAAIMLNTLLTHMLMLTPIFWPWSYSVLLGAWSLAKPPMLAVATWRHRNRVERYGEDRAWD